MQFIIRKKAYQYDNRVFYPENCSAGVHSIYSNLQDAQEARFDLERQLFGTSNFASVEYVPEIKAKVISFFKEKFNLSIWEYEELNQVGPFGLPETCTYDDFLELIKIMGASFFEIVIKDEKAIFYNPEINIPILETYFSKEVAKKIARINPFFVDEYEHGYRMYNTSDEAFDYGLLQLIENLKSIDFSKVKTKSNFSELIELLPLCKLDFVYNIIKFETEFVRDLMIKIVEKLDLIKINEQELWDAIYETLEDYEKEIRRSYNNGNVTYQSLSLRYGVPDFFIEMKLNGQLDD